MGCVSKRHTRARMPCRSSSRKGMTCMSRRARLIQVSGSAAWDWPEVYTPLLSSPSPTHSAGSVHATQTPIAPALASPSPPGPGRRTLQSAVDIDGAVVPLSRYAGSVVIVVNVASKCGFTDENYVGLQALYEKYHDKGLEILAFPSNQFGQQEPGSESEIKVRAEGVGRGNGDSGARSRAVALRPEQAPTSAPDRNTGLRHQRRGGLRQRRDGLRQRWDGICRNGDDFAAGQTVASVRADSGAERFPVPTLWTPRATHLLWLEC
eukprot:336484-Chlamydomonas_euryale.AAC.4